jgi:IS5 family transposase
VAVRRFIGIDLARESAPDAPTRLKFRRFLAQQKLTGRLFAAINEPLALHGLLLRKGIVVDAMIIAVPSSTKNRKGERDPERQQTKKSLPSISSRTSSR